ncbi:MAG TPA: hypothetical protein PLI59_10840 [Candidatus Obscuribacter sp.]|nr:hypothetical protein [Candidatus Obscuribacter sp.]HNG19664.1 hypothetical protein [Candidatus Obscuribacter sp.]HNG76264.1 hypothetical protein [Candidatus Obscuribacter sp.]HNH76707.1 hypothetical protein [Candidatus Obscuribacter sp.]
MAEPVESFREKSVPRQLEEAPKAIREGDVGPDFGQYITPVKPPRESHGKAADSVDLLYPDKKVVIEFDGSEKSEKKYSYKLDKSPAHDGSASDVSDSERQQAQRTIDNEFSRLIPEADRKAMGALTNALLSGDNEKLAETIQTLGKDPDKLKSYAGEVNKALENNGADTRIVAKADGKCFVYGSGALGLEIDPKTGDTGVFRLARDFDGNVYQGDEALSADTGKVVRTIANETTNRVNGDAAIHPPSGDYLAFEHPGFRDVKSIDPLIKDDGRGLPKEVIRSLVPPPPVRRLIPPPAFLAEPH